MMQKFGGGPKTMKCHPKFGCFNSTESLFSKARKLYPFPVEKVSPSFFLFTREQSAEPVEFKHEVTEEQLTNSTFSGGRPTFFITHGFMDFYDADNWNVVSACHYIVKFILLK